MHSYGLTSSSFSMATCHTFILPMEQAARLHSTKAVSVWQNVYIMYTISEKIFISNVTWLTEHQPTCCPYLFSYQVKHIHTI